MSRRNVVHLDHFVSIDQLNEAEIYSLIQRAQDYKKGITYRFLEPKFGALLFLENSTRTRYSFDMAAHRLSLKTLPFDSKTSSLLKGETLYDTITTMSDLGVDVLVIRTDQEKYYQPFIDNASIQCALINAGDGLELPTQTMIDLMTIFEEFGRFSGLKVGFVGDLDYSRVAKTNMKILKRLGAEIYFDGPSGFCSGVCQEYGQERALADFLPEIDVLMLFRLQKERHAVRMGDQAYFKAYGLTEARFAQLKETAIIMHPGPVNRNVEIATNLIESDKSRIRTQAQNAVFMNMAILEAVLV